MAKPKFYLEPLRNTDTKRKNEDNESSGKDIGSRAINMFYSFGGKRLQYYTGIRINPKHYQEKTNVKNIDPIKSIAPFASQYNKILNEMAADAVSIVTKARGGDLTVKYVRERLDAIYKPKPEPITIEEIKPTLLSYFDLVIAERKSGKRLISTGKNKGKKFSHNSLKNTRVTRSAILRYLNDRKLKDIKLENVNKEFYDDFLDYCYNEEKKEVSTFAGYIKDIKTIMIEAKGINFDTKDFVMPNYDSDAVALTLDQIDLIHNLDLSEKPRMDNIRDLFLVGCYSALRFSDFSSLKIESIENGFIRVKQIKTGANVTIPIMKRLQKVLDKHKGSLPRPVSNQEFNRVIKDVVEEAGLTHNVSVKSTAGNQTTYIDYPFYKLVSSHTGRRSYATIMFKKGVTPMLIMSATGHKTEKSFLRYIKATSEDKSKMLAELIDKLGL